MSKVLGLDSKTSGAAAWFGFTSGSTAVMIVLGLFASYLAWVQAHLPRAAAATSQEIDIVREEPPPAPPPEPAKEEEKPAAAPVHVATPNAPPPPPAPAAAAKVVTAEPDTKEVDLTNTVVEGNADSFAGGLTASNGTSTTAVHSMPAPSGVPGGTGPVTAPPVQVQGPDLSRPASVGGGAEWNCPFPAEADTAQIDDAYVTLQVDVRADGSPTAARVVADPGNGFGREARRCAMNKRYSTALDHDGHPIAGPTRPFRVHFSR
jgi:protein TonB